MSWLNDLISGAVGIAKAPIDYFFNSKLQNNQGSINQDLQENAYRLNEQAADNAQKRTESLNQQLWNREDSVNAKAATTAINGMKSAGLNVNAALGGGFSPSVSNQQSSQAGAQGSAPGASVGLNSISAPDLSNLLVNMAQANLLKKQGERQEIENDRLRDEDEWFKSHSGNYYIDENGTQINKDEAAKLVDEGKEVSMVLSPKYNSKGSFLAGGEIIERNVRRITAASDKLAGQLQSSILKIQNVDQETKDLLAAMPKIFVKKAVEELGILYSENKIKQTEVGMTITSSEMQKLQKSLLEFDVEDAKNARWSQFVEKIDNGDYGTAFVTAIGLILSKLSISSRLR